jgi:AcrR family transcriptional regulator
VSTDRLYGGEPLHARRRDQCDRLLAAARSVFAAKGYANTSIDEIVTKARVSRTSFYRFFSSKEECMLAVFEEAMAELAVSFARAAAADEPGERIRHGVEGIVASLASDPETATVVLIEAVGATPRVELARREARDRFARLLAAEMRRGGGWRKSSQAEIELTSRAVIAAIAEAVADLVVSGKTSDWREIVPPLTAFVVRALTPEGARVPRLAVAEPGDRASR